MKLMFSHHNESCQSYEYCKGKLEEMFLKKPTTSSIDKEKDALPSGLGLGEDTYIIEIPTCFLIGFWKNHGANHASSSILKSSKILVCTFVHTFQRVQGNHFQANKPSHTTRPTYHEPNTHQKS